MIKHTLLIALILFLAACGKKSEPAAPPEILAPGKAILTLPAQNALCTSGAVISDLQSTITFSWSSAANTDGYQLYIKNLQAGTEQTILTTTNQTQVTLLRNMPYAWSVTSKSSATSVTAVSETWKFYNAGTGVTSYAPFPPFLTGPTYGKSIATGTTLVNFTWTDSDVDNDIIGYDLYFGTTSVPPLLKSNITDVFFNNATVSANTTYYWKVVAKDALGNTSTSEIFQFKVN